MSSSGGMGEIGPMGRDPISTLEALRGGRIQGDQARLQAASNLLESAFFQQLFQAMRDTVPESELLGGGSGEDAFASLMDQHIAEVAANRLKGGLGQAIYRRFAGPGSDGNPETGSSAVSASESSTAPGPVRDVETARTVRSGRAG